jgi:hypothetical protein
MNVASCDEACIIIVNKALVAQWIERLVAVQKAGGPIPPKRTKNTLS